MSLPIHLDTDIGSNIDDAYALVLAATAPELKLTGVSVVNGDTLVRGGIADMLLRLLGYNGLVARGESNALDGSLLGGWHGFEGEGLDYPDDLEFEQKHAMVVMADWIRYGSCRDVVAIGQLTNVTLALRRVPEHAHEMTVWAMSSTFRGYGAEAAQKETNSYLDPHALAEVLASGARVKLVGLNVTEQTLMTRDDLEEIKAIDTPLSRALAAMHERYLAATGKDASPMHDPLTVAAAFRPDLLRFEPMRAEVDLVGRVVAFYDGEPNCEVAVDIEVDAFRSLFAERIKAAAIRT